MHTMVTAATRALAPLMCLSASRPRALCVAGLTSPRPAMHTTVPTTVGGNSGRRRPMTGPAAMVTTAISSVTPTSEPMPCVAMAMLAKPIIIGSGWNTSRLPLPQRPPQACMAVMRPMARSVRVTIDCVCGSGISAILAAAST